MVTLRTFLGYNDKCMDLKNTALGETSYCVYAMEMNITTSYNPSESQDEVCYSSDCLVPKLLVCPVTLRLAGPYTGGVRGGSDEPPISQQHLLFLV